MLCERRCGTNRLAGHRGFCKAGVVPYLHRHRIEYGEEAELIPSHMFYLSGCDLRCAFCIAGLNALDANRGRPLTPELFNSAVAWGQRQGAVNIQWVGGEPTIHLPAILDLMAQCPSLPPVVWKSDFHATAEAMEMLRGAVDVYLADCKFGNDACARRIAAVENYFRTVTRNLLIAAGHGRRLIVRHLLLPGHERCCYEPILAWMQRNLPAVAFSIRDSYLPTWRASQYDELAKPLPRSAAAAAAAGARRLGLQVIQ
jgi:putative pyruvate formate lyase activating enzyme